MPGDQPGEQHSQILPLRDIERSDDALLGTAHRPLHLLRSQMLQSGTESAGFAGLKWMHGGIGPSKLFQ